jgi:rhodanese-related sulfurtransferase
MIVISLPLSAGHFGVPFLLVNYHSRSFAPGINVAFYPKPKYRREEMGKMSYRFGFLMILFAIGLLGHLIPKGWSMDKKGYENISVDQFAEMMNHKDLILINVHIPYEGEIPGTDLLIPFNAIDRHKNELPNNKDTKIVVYCMTGPMGDIAAERLVRMGYTRVIHFQGGMKAWKRAGRRLLFRLK